MPEMRDVLNPSVFLKEATEESLARAIAAALALPPDERERERAKLRAYVAREHSLSTIAGQILENMYPRRNDTASVTT